MQYGRQNLNIKGKDSTQKTFNIKLNCYDVAENNEMRILYLISRIYILGQARIFFDI